MAIGYICPCCGESCVRPEDVDAAVLFMCAPCGEQPKAPPPDMSQDEILARQLAEQEGAVIEEGHLEKNEFGRFMCPAGCDKTFKFAGAAIKHGTKCVQDLRKRRRRGGASAPRPAPKRWARQPPASAPA